MKKKIYGLLLMPFLLFAACKKEDAVSEKLKIETKADLLPNSIESNGIGLTVTSQAMVSVDFTSSYASLQFATILVSGSGVSSSVTQAVTVQTGYNYTQIPITLNYTQGGDVNVTLQLGSTSYSLGSIRYYSIPSSNNYNTDVLKQGDVKVTVVETGTYNGYRNVRYEFRWPKVNDLNAGSRPQFVTVQGKLNGVYAKTTANLSDRYAALNFTIPSYIVSAVGAAVAANGYSYDYEQHDGVPWGYLSADPQMLYFPMGWYNFDANYFFFPQLNP